MFCASSLVVQRALLGFFDRISVVLNECAADIDASNLTRPRCTSVDRNEKRNTVELAIGL